MIIFLFLGYFALGLWNMSPSVNFGDSGEFIASAATLSLPHAPSFPLFCLLGKAFGTLVPFGNWAYRTNMFSVFCGALCLVCLYRCARLLGAGAPAAVCGVLLFGLCPTVMHENVVTEVFSLNMLWACLGILAFLMLRDELWTFRAGAVAGIWAGLGLGNHHTLLLVMPAFLWEAFSRPPDWRQLGEFLKGFLIFLAAGLSIYIYLPIRSSHFPPFDWGHPTTIDRIMHVFLRRDYGSFSLTVGGPEDRSLVLIAKQAWRFLAYSAVSLGWPAILISIAGFYVWAKGGKKAGWRFPVLFTFFAGPFFLCLGNPPFTSEMEGVLGRFYLLSWLPLSLAVSLGVQFFIGRFGRAGLVFPAIALAWLLPASRVWALRSDFACYDYGRNLLRSLPENAVFFMDGGDDTFYSLAYLQFAQGMRQDLKLHDRGGLVFRSPYGGDFRSLARDEKEKRRVAVESLHAASGPTYFSTMKSKILPGFNLVPVGLVQKVVPEGKSEGVRSTSLWPFYVFRYDLARLKHHYRDRALVPFHFFSRGMMESFRGNPEEALLFWKKALILGPDVEWLSKNLSFSLALSGYNEAQKGRWAQAERIYRFHLKYLPESAEIWTNLGVALEKQNSLAEAEAANRMAIGIDPEYAQAYYNLGVMYWRKRDWKSAAESFEKAVELKPGMPLWRSYLEKARQQAKTKESN